MKSPLLILTTILFPFFLTAQMDQFWESHAEGLLPKDYVVYNVTTLDEDNIWAICWRQPAQGFLPVDHEIKILKTENGGANWEVISMSDFQGYFSLDFQLIDVNTAWMSVQDLALTKDTKIIKTEDGGKTWQTKYEGEAAGLWVRFFNEKEGFAGNFPFVATTSDGGLTWQTDSLENKLRDDDFNMSSNSCVILNDVVWAGTTDGTVGKSLDKGKTWEFYDVGLGSASQISAVAFKDKMNGMALGNSFVTRFSTTNDGGVTWKPLGPTGFTKAYNLEYVPGTRGTFMACSAWGSPTVSAYTNDFGENWTTATTGYSFGGISFIGPGVGWAGTAWVEDEQESSILYKWIGDGLSKTKNRTIAQTEVFPNPTSDILNLQIDNQTNLEFIQIYNAIGEIVFTSTESIENQINISFLPKGCYFLQFGNDEAIYNSQFVKN